MFAQCGAEILNWASRWWQEQGLAEFRGQRQLRGKGMTLRRLR